MDIALIREAIIIVILVIISLSLHEWGHAYAADKLGDPTPRSQGRVTLDPLAHIDLVGTVLIPLFGALGFFGNFSGIGWAKPVETNPSYLRRGYLDRAIITLAGPAVNLALAFAAALVLVVSRSHSAPITELFTTALYVNVGLFVFNLLPIPPLDGSKFLIYTGIVSEEAYVKFASFGWVMLIILINLPPFRVFFGTLIHNFAQILMLPARYLG